MSSPQQAGPGLRLGCRDNDAELVRLTQLRQAADLRDGDGDAESAAACADALQPAALHALVERAQTATDPVRARKRAPSRRRASDGAPFLQCVAFAASAALRALARRPEAPRAMLCAVLFEAAAAPLEAESGAARGAKRRRVASETSPDADADSVAAASLQLLHGVLRDAADGEEALEPGALCAGVAASVAAASSAANSAAAAARTLHAARLLKSCLRRAAGEAAALCAAALESSPTLLPRLLAPSAPCAHRHVALSLLRAAAPVASPAVAAAVAVALACGCEALLMPPSAEDTPPSDAACWTPFTRGGTDDDDGGAMRRRALRAAALLCRAFADGAASSDASLRHRWATARAQAERNVPAALAHAWAHATRDAASAEACAAATCSMLAAEDDVLTETLTAAAAAGLGCPAALLAAASATLREDESLLLDLLLEAASGTHLLALLCAAGRALVALGADGDAARAAWRRRPGDAAARTVGRLGARLTRLHAAGLLPFNAAPLLRRLEDMRREADDAHEV
jgi:hypothetical protein